MIDTSSILFNEFSEACIFESILCSCRISANLVGDEVSANICLFWLKYFLISIGRSLLEFINPIVKTLGLRLFLIESAFSQGDIEFNANSCLINSLISCHL